jgi:SAM-dependent methyltransferase
VSASWIRFSPLARRNASRLRDDVVRLAYSSSRPDLDTAVDEMVRVLRPGGRLILVDHVASSSRLARGVQRLLELITVPQAGEHFLRRPLHQVQARGLHVEQRERFKLGLVERLVARKPPHT